MKIAIIGGASSYTPELVDGLFERLDRIPVSELWLMDINQERLAVTAGLSQRMAAAHGTPFSIHHTTNLKEAVRDAAYVVTQLRVGGIQARINDEKLGLRHGIIGQETTGVGGFACALRTIPPVLEIARAMEELAPAGKLVNFTNPSGIITEALLKHSPVTSVGLCNVPICMIMDIVEHTGCDMEDVALDYVGLNHLSWVRGVKVKDKDITQQALDRFYQQADEEWEDPVVCAGMRLAMERLHCIPNGYLQYYYSTKAKLAEIEAKGRTRGEEVVEIEAALFEKYAQPELKKKPEELSKRGGAHYSTAAFHLIDAMHNDTGSKQIVCCRNQGAVPTFGQDVAVEVTASIGKDGAAAVAQKAPDPAIRGLMQLIKAYESLTVEAAVTGDRERAFQAMLTHPLMPDAQGSQSLLDELLDINKPHLEGTFF